MNMTVNERAEYAAELKKTMNCCQAVAAACGDRLNVDPEVLHQLTSGFGAGMGCMEATCGALCGAVIAAGLLKKGQGTPGASRKILREFERRSGATICKDLKGIETGKVLCECSDCVRNAVYALESVLPQNE